jgi:hypothetical protein
MGIGGQQPESSAAAGEALQDKARQYRASDQAACMPTRQSDEPSKKTAGVVHQIDDATYE